MKRHLRWLIPLILVPICYFGGLLPLSMIEHQPGYQTDAGLQFAGLALVALSVLGPLVAAIVALVGGITTFRRWRRRTGHMGRKERAALALHAQQQDASAQAWTAARDLRQRLVAREVPAAVTVWEVVPNAGEVMFFDLVADYARYYGRDVTYSHNSGFFFGHPAFVIAGLAATGIGNAARRSAAQSAAQATWRE